LTLRNSRKKSGQPHALTIAVADLRVFENTEKEVARANSRPAEAARPA
jgi:hypothetical protein